MEYNLLSIRCEQRHTDRAIEVDEYRFDVLTRLGDVYVLEFDDFELTLWIDESMDEDEDVVPIIETGKYKLTKLNKLVKFNNPTKSVESIELVQLNIGNDGIDPILLDTENRFFTITAGKLSLNLGALAAAEKVKKRIVWVFYVSDDKHYELLSRIQCNYVIASIPLWSTLKYDMIVIDTRRVRSLDDIKIYIRPIENIEFIEINKKARTS